MDFIKGNWYKGFEDSHYIKFSHIISVKGYSGSSGYNEIHFTEGNRDGKGNNGYSCEGKYWANSNMEKFALLNPVTQEELEKILPQDHPDLNINQSYEIY